MIGRRNRFTPVLLGAGALALGAAVTMRALRAKRYIRLNGKVVLIIGGSRGLGLDLARAAAMRGAIVALAARDSDELERAAKIVADETAAQVAVFRCDATDQDAVTALMNEVVGRFGTIDVLINDAGLIEVGPMRTMQLGEYEAALSVNLRAPLHAMLAVLPIFRRRGGGRIVNVASVGGKIAVPHLLPYSVSKFALVGLSGGMRNELIKENIFVTTVMPGLFRGGSARQAQFRGNAAAERAWFTAASVMPIVSMDPRRLARKILDAAQHGDAQLIAPLLTHVQARFADLLPGVTSELLSLVDRLLPKMPIVGERAAKHPPRLPAMIRRRDERAAEQHNQVFPAS